MPVQLGEPAATRLSRLSRAYRQRRRAAGDRVRVLPSGRETQRCAHRHLRRRPRRGAGRTIGHARPRRRRRRLPRRRHRGGGRDTAVRASALGARRVLDRATSPSSRRASSRSSSAPRPCPPPSRRSASASIPTAAGVEPASSLCRQRHRRRSAHARPAASPSIPTARSARPELHPHRPRNMPIPPAWASSVRHPEINAERQAECSHDSIEPVRDPSPSFRSAGARAGQGASLGLADRGRRDRRRVGGACDRAKRNSSTSPTIRRGSSTARSTRLSPRTGKRKTGETVDGPRLAWRLRRAGPRGDRRPRRRRGDAGARRRHRRHRAADEEAAGRLADAPAATIRRPTPRRSCSSSARAIRRASRTGTISPSPASRSSRRTRRPRAARAGTISPPGAMRSTRALDETRPRRGLRAGDLQECAGARHRRARLD